MKKMMAILLLVSGSVFASECERNLLERLGKDSNLKIVKMLDTYSCGKVACAVTFEHDSSPFPNSKVLAFLDLKSGMKVNWVPVNGERIVGHETFKGKKRTYVSSSNVGSDRITIEASIETPRDSLFWPPHRVYYKENFSCVKL